MALTRKFLSALGIEADKVEEIITAHVETVNALKEERDQLKSKADKVDEMSKQIEEYSQAKNGDNSYKEQFEKLTKEFEDYKKDVELKELNANKGNEYKKLLSEAGVSDKYLDKVLKVTDLSELEFNDGKFKDAESISKTIKDEWSEFIVTTKKVGATTANPPANDGNSFEQMNITEKMRYANEHPNSEEVKAWLSK